MKQEDEPEKQRHPGRIEESQKARTGQETAQCFQVADRLASRAATRSDAVFDEGGEQIVGDMPVEARSKPHEDAAAHQFQQCADADEAHSQQRKHIKRILAPRRQHAVVDLQHVER